MYSYVLGAPVPGDRNTFLALMKEIREPTIVQLGRGPLSSYISAKKSLKVSGNKVV